MLFSMQGTHGKFNFNCRFKRFKSVTLCNRTHKIVDESIPKAIQHRYCVFILYRLLGQVSIPNSILIYGHLLKSVFKPFGFSFAPSSHSTRPRWCDCAGRRRRTSRSPAAATRSCFPSACSWQSKCMCGWWKRKGFLVSFTGLLFVKMSLLIRVTTGRSKKKSLSLHVDFFFLWWSECVSVRSFSTFFLLKKMLLN